MTNIHIINRPTKQPQPFLSRVEIKSFNNCRSRILGGIPEFKHPEFRRSKFKSTMTGQQGNSANMAFLRAKPLTVKTKTTKGQKSMPTQYFAPVSLASSGEGGVMSF